MEPQETLLSNTNYNNLSKGPESKETEHRPTLIASQSSVVSHKACSNNNNLTFIEHQAVNDANESNNNITVSNRDTNLTGKHTSIYDILPNKGLTIIHLNIQAITNKVKIMLITVIIVN